jgi:hypothetical protein
LWQCLCTMPTRLNTSCTNETLLHWLVSTRSCAPVGTAGGTLHHHGHTPAGFFPRGCPHPTRTGQLRRKCTARLFLSRVVSWGLGSLFVGYPSTRRYTRTDLVSLPMPYIRINVNTMSNDSLHLAGG